PAVSRPRLTPPPASPPTSRPSRPAGTPDEVRNGFCSHLPRRTRTKHPGGEHMPTRADTPQSVGDEQSPRSSKPSKPSKKDQILELFRSGLGDVNDIALITRSRPSYVASVLQSEGEMSGYFDLYTT